MPIKILSDIVDVVSEHISNPGTSGFEIFVGLEHYDSGDPIITRYGSTNNLASSVKHFVSGDILVARRNVYLRRAGIVRFEGVTSGDSIVLRVKDKEYSDILPFILNTDDFWDYAEQNSDGTMSKRLAPDVLLEYECNIPDNHYQIANKLWAAYRLKESYKRLLAATDEMVKSQFIEMFKLLPVNGTINDLTEGSPTSVKKTYSNEDMIEYIDITSIDSASKTVQETSKHFVGKAPSRAQQCVKNGDILVSTVRPVNRNVAVIDNNIPNLVASTGFCVLRPKEGYKDYILLVVTSDLFTDKMCDKASGGLYPAVNNNDVLNYGIHIPDEALANRVSVIYQQADKSKFELRKSIDAIDKVIKSLINS